MKRKVKKFNGEDGSRVYDKEDEGLLGGKIKYREDEEGRKFVAGKANPYDRNPAEQRYYSKDDVKKGLSNVGDKISNFFGGKKEDSSSKFDELESVGGASRRPRTIQEQISGKSEEAPRRQMTDSMTNKPKAADKTFLREEANIDYKPAKQTAPVVKKSKIEEAAPAVKKAKASMDSGFPKDTKSTRMPIGYDKLDLRSPEEKYKPGISKERQEKADKAVYAGWRKNKIDMTKRKSAEDMKYDEQGNAYKRGGKVKSASARADGCAIRGKTRA